MVLVFLVLLAVVAPDGKMAALVGHDRVTATYPGFRSTEGDATALAANGMQRDGMMDAIVIRKISTLTASGVAAFDEAGATRLAISHPPLVSEYVSAEVKGVSNQVRFKACRNTAYGLTSVRSVTLRTIRGPMKWTELDVYVLQLAGRDVWQATYSRLYDPELDKEGASLIRFTANFCVQQNYR